jgi:hypothetical protein
MQLIYPPKPINSKDTTYPPKVVDLKFRAAPYIPTDGDAMTFDFIELFFVNAKIDSDSRSEADQYFIEIKDLDNNFFKAYVQNAFANPYILWQRSFEIASDYGEFVDAEIEGGIVNAKIRLTPVNTFGEGKKSIFFLPLKDLKYSPKYNQSSSPTTLIISKYWDLYSPDPYNIYERPKYIYIYVDIDPEIALLDKIAKNDDKWKYTTLGYWKNVNQKTYRWILYNKKYYKIDENDNILFMSDIEIEYITNLIRSFNESYYAYLNENSIKLQDVHQFKIATENPADHQDSIIIYLMKGLKWRI